MLLHSKDKASTVTIPVLCFTQEPPFLREEYENYALVQYISLSTWKQIQGIIGNSDPDIIVRVLSENSRSLEELEVIGTELTSILGHDLSYVIENRVQERIDNDAMLNGYKIVIGAVCPLLAIIGIAMYRYLMIKHFERQ